MIGTQNSRWRASCNIYWSFVYPSLSQPSLWSMDKQRATEAGWPPMLVEATPPIASLNLLPLLTSAAIFKVPSTLFCDMSLMQREQLLIVWYIFSSFSSVSSNDYNQVFFLILQWAKEQRIVQRVSLWGALYWMVSNTWGSGLQVGFAILPLGIPRKSHLFHQPFSSTPLSHS